MRVKDHEKLKELKAQHGLPEQPAFTFATLWADMIEHDMSYGPELEAVAADAADRAAVYMKRGVSDEVKGIAVWILFQVWEQGERLHAWHQRQTK
jgi:hypothetical protein